MIDQTTALYSSELFTNLLDYLVQQAAGNSAHSCDVWLAKKWLNKRANLIIVTFTL